MEDRSLKRPKGATQDRPEAAEIEGPFGHMLMDDAWKKGRTARSAGKPRECPLPSYPGRGVQRAWLEGWDSLGPTIVHAEPAIQTRPVAITTPGQFWPKEKALPTHYIRPEALPCRLCFALLTSSLVQAVVTRATSGSVAYLWCRACNSGFSMPIAAAPPMGPSPH